MRKKLNTLRSICDLVVLLLLLSADVNGFVAGDRQSPSQLNVQVGVRRRIDDVGVRNDGGSVRVAVATGHVTRDDFNVSGGVSSGHRIRRATPGDIIGHVSNGLLLLGVAAGFANPIAGGVLNGVGILFAIVKAVLPVDDPTLNIRNMVLNERAELQRAEFISIREHMTRIIRYNESNAIEADRMILTLYSIIDTARCLFMRQDGIESSVDYFVKFAKTHMAVIHAVMLTRPNDTAFWQETLETTVAQYVTYGDFVVYKLEDRNHFNNSLRLADFVSNCTKLLPNQTQLSRLGAIPSGATVSFGLTSFYRILVSPLFRGWLSGWSSYGSKSKCSFKTCPGSDNPMERGSRYRHHWKCRGEIFNIESVDEPNGGIIKTCSRVAVYYTKIGRNQPRRWLTEDLYLTTDCTGGTAWMRDGHCKQEVLRIEASGKECGVPITDRDRVQLKSAYNNESLEPVVLFVIFRSDVEYDHYRSYLPCSS